MAKKSNRVTSYTGARRSAASKAGWATRRQNAWEREGKDITRAKKRQELYEEFDYEGPVYELDFEWEY